MQTALFQSCGHCWVFQICWHIECSTFTASSFRIWNSSTGILSPPLGQVFWYSHVFQNCPQFVVIHTIKGFGIVNKADVFSNSLCLMIQRMLAIWSLVSLPFLNPAWTSGSSQFMYLLKPGLENFEHYFASVWDECNCAVVWTLFGIAFLWDWNENWPFPVLWHCWVFQICWHIECSTFTASSFRIWNSSTGIPSPPLAVFAALRNNFLFSFFYLKLFLLL